MIMDCCGCASSPRFGWSIRNCIVIVWLWSGLLLWVCGLWVGSVRGWGWWRLCLWGCRWSFFCSRGASMMVFSIYVFWMVVWSPIMAGLW